MKKLLIALIMILALFVPVKCIGDVVFHSDRDYYGAVMWPTSMVDYPDNGWFVEGYEIPYGYSLKCIMFDMCAKMNVVDSNRSMDIVIMSSNDYLEPDSILYEFVGFELPDSMPIFPNIDEIVFNLPDSLVLNDDYVFIGFKPNFGEDVNMYFIGADRDQWGKSWTLSSREGWIPVSKNWPFVRSIGIGICLEPCNPVSVYTSGWGAIKNLYR